MPRHSIRHLHTRPPHPLGRRERIERVQAVDPAEMPQGEPIPAGFEGAALNWNCTFQWTKQALAAGSGRENARITQWAISAETGEVVALPASTKLPLTNRT